MTILKNKTEAAIESFASASAWGNGLLPIMQNQMVSGYAFLTKSRAEKP